jgi:hypothetical protein
MQVPRHPQLPQEFPHRENGGEYNGDLPALKKDLEFPDLRSRIGYMVRVGFDDNQSELARALNTGPGTIGNWLARNQGMDPAFAFVLQDRYRWNARWLLEGVLPRRMEVSDEEAEALYQQILSLPPDRRRAILLLLGNDS